MRYYLLFFLFVLFAGTAAASQTLTLGASETLSQHNVSAHWNSGGVYHVLYGNKEALITAQVKYNNNFYTLPQMKSLRPGIVFRDVEGGDDYQRKFGVNITNISQADADKVQALCLNLTGLVNLETSDFERIDYEYEDGTHQGWMIKNKVFYDTWAGPGITVNITGRTVCYSGFTGNTSIYIDPTITLNSTNPDNSNLDDAKAVSAAPSYNYGTLTTISVTPGGVSNNFLIKWNTSQVAGKTVTSSQMSFFLTANGLDAGESVNVCLYRVKQFPDYSINETEWTEGTGNNVPALSGEYSWNNRPNSSQYNTTALACVFLSNDSPTSTWYVWNFTEQYTDANATFLANATIVSGSVSNDPTTFSSKEAASNRPQWNITYEDEAPSAPSWVTLSGVVPGNNTGGSENMTFNATPAGSFAVFNNVSLFFNGTLNQTASAVNNTECVFNVTGLGSGEHSWYIFAGNSTLNNVSDTRNYTVTTTTTTTTTTIPLSVEIQDPKNETVYNASSLPFLVRVNYSWVGGNQSAVCSLYVNGSLNQTNNSVDNNTLSFFDVYFAIGNYALQINATANQTSNTSKTVYISVVTTTTPTTTTTIPRLDVGLSAPPNDSSGPPDNMFNFSVNGTNLTYLCSLYFNGTLNQSIMAANQTINGFSVSGLGEGLWPWNVTCWINATVYNSSQTWEYTSVTTTTQATTTTLMPHTGTGYTNEGVLWIYSILFPLMAAGLTLAGFHFKNNFLPSYSAGLMWYISTFTTRDIIFIGNFSVSAATKYTDLGNPEFNWLYMGLGILMFVYGTLIILKDLKRQGIINQKTED